MVHDQLCFGENRTDEFELIKYPHLESQYYACGMLDMSQANIVGLARPCRSGQQLDASIRFSVRISAVLIELSDASMNNKPRPLLW